jgi:hypothetical protein
MVRRFEPPAPLLIQQITAWINFKIHNSFSIQVMKNGGNHDGIGVAFVFG